MLKFKRMIINGYIKNFLKEKGALKFSFLKFLEIGITALTTLIVARKVGPREMGLSVEILLYITYANYLSLGLNQVVIKNYSRIKLIGDLAVRNFLTINIQYLLLISVLNFLISYFILDYSFFVLTAIISSSVLIRSFATSYFRVVYRIGILNKNNLIYASILLFLTLFFVNRWKDYMIVWSVASVISLSLYFIDGRKVFIPILKNISYIAPKKEFIFNFSEGIKLAITGVITTLLLTSDRIIVAQKDISLELKGIYQLSDYISMAIYMVITTVLFYYYPFLIQSIRENAEFRINLYNKIRNTLYILPVLLFGIFLLSKIASIVFFDEYTGLEYYATASSFMKIIVVLLSMLSMFYIGLDKEMQYIKSLIPLMILYGLVIIVSIAINNVSLITIPLIFGSLLLIEFIRRMNHIKSILNTK